MIDSKIIAHRFGATLGPENTKAALMRSLEIGVQWVEFDASLLKDGNVIVFHDETFDRCSDHSGPVADATLEEVRKIDGGSWFSPAYKNEKILELTEALEILQNHQVKINLEIKANGDEAIELTEAVYRIVTKAWPHAEDLLYSSFSHDALMHLRKLNPQAAIGHLFEKMPMDWQEQAQEVQALSIHGDADEFDLSHIQAVKKAGFKLYLYTVNDVKRAQELIAFGTDSIFTDSPHLFDPCWL